MAKDDVVMKLDANTAAFVEAIRRAQDKMQSFTDTAEKTGPKVDKLSSMVLKLEKSFGNLKIGDVGAELLNMFELPLTPAAAMETAAKGIKSVLQQIRDEALAGAEALKSVESQTKTLIQTSASLGEFKERKQQAESIAREYGLSREKAYGLVGQVAGAGMSDKDARTFAQTNAFAEDPGALVSDVVKIKSNFKDAGSTRNTINAIGIAAGESPGVDLNNLTPAIAGTAQILSKIKTTANEAIAAVSVAAEVFKSPTTGADRIQAVGNKLDKLGYNKKGLIGNFEDYQAAQKAAEPNKKLLSEMQQRQDAIDKRKLEIDMEASKRPGGKRTRSMDKEFNALTLEDRELGMKSQALKKLIPEDFGDDQEVKAGAELLLNHSKAIRARQMKLMESDKAAEGADWMSSREQIVRGDPAEVAKIRAQRAASERAGQAAALDGPAALRSQAALDEMMTRSRTMDSAPARALKSAVGTAALELGGDEGTVTAAGELAPRAARNVAGSVLAGSNPAAQGAWTLVVEAVEKLVSKTDEQNKLLTTRKGTALENNSEGQK